MPRQPKDFKPYGGRKPTNFQAIPDTPITNKFGGYFKPKTVDPETGSVIPDYVPGYDATRDLFQTKKEPPLNLEDAIRLASTAATFGQQPRISALTESFISDKPYDKALTENQAMLEYIRKKNPVASKAIEIPVSLAATAPLQGASILGRIGIGAGIGAGYGSEQQDLTTSDGLINTGFDSLIGGGGATIPSVLKGGSDFVKKSIKEAQEGGTTVKNLIRDYIVKKNKPEILETLVNKPNTISDLANIGSKKVREKLGKDIAPFRQEAFNTTTNKIQTPEAIAILDELNPPISQSRAPKLSYTKETPITSADDYMQTIIDKPDDLMKQAVPLESQLPIGTDKFLNDIKSRLQKPKSSADVLSIVDDLDDESKKFYKQIKKGEKRDLTKNENRYYTSLVDARNSLKEKLRSPESDWGGVDKMFNQFEKDLPAIKSLEQAKFDYAKRKAQADFPQLNNDMASSGRVFPSKTGLFSKVLDVINPGGGLKYTDQISEDIANKLVDPDILMQLIQQGDKEILPNVRPTGILKALQSFGVLDKDIMRASTYNALGNVLASQSPKIMNEE